MKAGWTARLSPLTLMPPEFAPPPGIRPRLQLVPVPPAFAPGPMMVLDRIVLEAWWTTPGGPRRTLTFESYKRNILVPGE